MRGVERIEEGIGSLCFMLYRDGPDYCMLYIDECKCIDL